MRRLSERAAGGEKGRPVRAAGTSTGAVHPLARLHQTGGNRAVQRYLLTRTPYTGNAVTWQAVALRASSPQGLKNIASIKLAGKDDLVTASSIPPGPKGVTPKHSEQVVWEKVAGACKGGAKIEWVYTEREPCGQGPGMKNCASFLNGLLATHGAAGNNTPVYYSFTYPSPQEVKAVAKWFLDNQAVTTEDDAYDAAYDLWIQEHGETKQMIAEAQKMFSQPGPWAASAMSS